MYLHMNFYASILKSKTFLIHVKGFLHKLNYTIGPRREKTCLRGFAKKHRRRPACASAQSDQRLCYSLFGNSYVKFLQVNFQFSS